MDGHVTLIATFSSQLLGLPANAPNRVSIRHPESGENTVVERTKLLSALAATALVATPTIASADIIPISVEGGYLHSTDGQNAGGAVVTLHGVGVHVPLLSPQLSLAAPLTSGGGRYALTTEAALHVPATGYVPASGPGSGGSTPRCAPASSPTGSSRRRSRRTRPSPSATIPG
jgi:hypothetical protein